jgi:dTDP-4-dehydrorhamnose 3,5-epimerase-like enzyme
MTIEKQQYKIWVIILQRFQKTCGILFETYNQAKFHEKDQLSVCQDNQSFSKGVMRFYLPINPLHKLS